VYICIFGTPVHCALGRVDVSGSCCSHQLHLYLHAFVVLPVLSFTYCITLLPPLQQYDSDEGETGDGPEEPAHKKPKTSSGGGSSGTSGGGGSGGGGTGGGGGGGGANRAARRAGAGK